MAEQNKDLHVQSEGSRTLLVLGAGLLQRPSIEAAKSLGCRVVVVDGNPGAPCIPLADEFFHIDLKDQEGIRHLALELFSKGRLHGVFTAGTDFSSTVSYVGEACGLPVHSYQAACNASHKVRMRRCFQTAGVPSPVFKEFGVRDIELAVCRGSPAGLWESTGLPGDFPLVVKPVDNMGGRGCRLVGEHKELEAALEEALENSRSHKAIVEEYMAGPEFSIDAIVYQGTVTICGFADRHIFFPPYFIEMGHTIPTDIPAAAREQLISTFVRGIHALGLTCGAAKADIKLTDNGPMIGEIAARLSGGYMSGWTYPYSSGFFLTKQAVAIAMGMEPDELLARRHPVQGLPSDLPFAVYEVPSSLHCAERAWISIPGKVKAIHGIGEAACRDGVKEVLPRCNGGDVVVFPRNNVEKCGNIVAVGFTRKEAAIKAESAVKSIVLELSPNQKETDVFLDRETAVCEGMHTFPPLAFCIPDEVQREFQLYCKECRDMFDVSKSLFEQLPTCLAGCLDGLQDWNCRSMRETIALAEEVFEQWELDAACCISGLSLVRLWRACILGGVQGVLYVVSSACRRND